MKVSFHGGYKTILQAPLIQEGTICFAKEWVLSPFQQTGIAVVLFKQGEKTSGLTNNII